jgi:hypothetical protein
MHAFVYRLVERLTHDGPKLSRNRHFHTFASPEGRRALRIARELRAVARDIAAAAPRRPVLDRGEDRVRVEIPIEDGVRVAFLEPEAWEILQLMPVVRAALAPEAPGHD